MSTNRIWYSLLCILSIFVIASCRTAPAVHGPRVGTYSSSDYFRIPLAQNDGPTVAPPGTHPSNASTWNDVNDWQNFLLNVMMYDLPSPPYPTDNFDPTTVKWTRQFQTDAQIPVNGKVDSTTYNKAVNYYGMQRCTPTPHP